MWGIDLWHKKIRKQHWYETDEIPAWKYPICDPTDRTLAVGEGNDVPECKKCLKILRRGREGESNS